MDAKPEQKMPGLTAQAIAARDFLLAAKDVVFQYTAGGLPFTVYLSEDSLWAVANFNSGGRMAFRMAFSPIGSLQLEKTAKTDNGMRFYLGCAIGRISVKLGFPTPEKPFIRYTTALTTKEDVRIPSWPRDILPLGKASGPFSTKGEIYVRQTGLRSGLLYMGMKKPRSGSIFYFQNLTELGEYCDLTENSLADAVGGTWPEIGLALPPAVKKPIPAGKRVVISDALIAFEEKDAKDEFELSKKFLEYYAQIYEQLPIFEPQYADWPAIADDTLKCLENCGGCWTHTHEASYLNAYLSDYNSPPESMVQLAVLMPLMEYGLWKNKDIHLTQNLKAILPNFFDGLISSIGRWLPFLEEKLDGSEEHKKPRVMDAWYVYHPLLNLSRMALNGDKDAEKMFLDSLDFVIKVARHFRYRWPIFYDLDTLEIIKAEAKPGQGGENDVAGLHVYVMLKAWQLTDEKRFLDEAEKAATSLKGFGFNLFYQANNTAFGAGALLQLYKATKNELYLNLSYVCLANIFKNMGLWECRYGYGKKRPYLLSLFPLNDAPYTAAYEEHEVYTAFNYYLALAANEPVLPYVSHLLSEFIRLLTYKAIFYYPPHLQADMLVDEKPKTGELDKNLWLPIEDLQDGWKKSGTVGQEVYGAGQAFGIVTRQYRTVPGEQFLVFVDYPIGDFKVKSNNASLQILGGDRFPCKMRLIPLEGNLLPNFKVTGTSGGKDEVFNEEKTKEGHLKYRLHGSMEVLIEWKHPAKTKANKK